MSEIQTRKINAADNRIPEVSVSDTSSEDRLLKFVDEQIENMRKYSELGGGCPGFFELNDALSNWSNINCSLIALDVMAKQEHQKAKDAYEEFIADKYYIIRNEYNLQSVSAQKWLSTQEIMMMIQRDPRWVWEYRSLRNEMNETEKKVAFCRRILDNWESLKYNIGTLSRNVVAESANFAAARQIGLEQN